MSIKTEINSVTEIQSITQLPKKPFPCLRQWRGIPDTDGPIVVLFTKPIVGVVLVCGDSSRIGKSEEWVHYDHKDWEPCSITLTSET